MKSFEMLSVYNVETPMRDGVLLRGDLYRPAHEGRYPLLLLRGVFRKRDAGRGFGQYDPSWYVRRGYAVFFQDVRGLGESDGEFDRFTADGRDGYDTIEWLAAQPFCNGRIGMFGNYYAGYLQLMAAAEAPPHLLAICPMQTSVSINRDCDNRGFLFASHIGWCMSRLLNRLDDGRYDEAITSKQRPFLRACLRDYPVSQLSHWPLNDMPVLKNTPFPLLESYRKHLLEGYDDFVLLHKEGRDLDLSRVRVPAFYACGWYDSSRTPLIDHCMAQRRAGVDSRVLIAPWRPGEAPARTDSALENGECAVSIQEDMTAWFDHYLKDAPALGWPPVRYYDPLGGLTAREVWQQDGEAQESWYLSGEKTLSLRPDGDGAPPDRYLHDPKRPLPYRGYGADTPSEEAGERTLEYLSPPMEDDRALCGLVRAEISLSSTAPDADVMVSLIDVSPTGRRFRICDGATRARYREDWVSRPLEKDRVYPMEVLLGHVRYDIPKGHRIALEIGGSAFPKYDVNHGTAKRPAEDADFVSSENFVHHTARQPSLVILPLVKKR